jgi:2-methylcitrate dehydratase PrpD
MNVVTEALVDHALALRWDGLSREAQRAAHLFLEDTLCVGIAGRNAPNADRVLAAARLWSGGGSARVLGCDGPGLTPAYAAFVNAFQIHAQEFDCVHEPAVAHPLATVVSALLSATVGQRVAGRDFLTAMVAGVDIVAALGVAVTTPLKFFRPATAGIFGSVAALARLHGLDRETALDAFGHALAFASGTMQAHIEGKPGLALQVAAAARSALEAIDLARLGISAPRAAIDGAFGYARLFEDGFSPERILGDLAARERIRELSWKPFPTGRAAHGAIVALQTMMREHGVSAETLVRFTYNAPPLIARLVGRRPVVDMQPPYARLCMPYLSAVTLRRGTVSLDDFNAASLCDPQTMKLAERFRVEADSNADPAAFVPAEAIAELVDGRRVTLAIQRQLGAPDWPLTPEQHRAKADACLAFAGRSGSAPALRAALAEFAVTDDVAAALDSAFGD